MQKRKDDGKNILLASIIFYLIYSLPFMPHNAAMEDLRQSWITEMNLMNTYNNHYLKYDIACTVPLDITSSYYDL